jgi:hypothetical protein
MIQETPLSTLFSAEHGRDRKQNTEIHWQKRDIYSANQAQTN